MMNNFNNHEANPSRRLVFQLFDFLVTDDKNIKLEKFLVVICRSYSK